MESVGKGHCLNSLRDDTVCLFYSRTCRTDAKKALNNSLEVHLMQYSDV